MKKRMFNTYKNLTLSLLVSYCTELLGFSHQAIHVDDSGNSIAIWQEVVDQEYVVKASYLSNGSSSWATPVAISSSGTFNSFNPQMISNSNGDIVCVWRQSDEEKGNLFLMAAMLPSGSSAWTSPTQLSSSDESAIGRLVLSMNTTGCVYALWGGIDADNNNLLQSTSSQVNTSNIWSTPVLVSPTS